MTTAPFEFSGDALDPSFGDQGAVLTPFGDTSVEIANASALDGQGRIVLAGSYVPAGGGDSEFALARYNPDGSLDATFGTSGRVTTDLSSGEDYVLGMVLDAEGRIVVAGAYNGIAGDYGAGDFAVARYTSSGSLDESFSSDGWTNVDFYGLNDEARGIGIDSQGRLIAAGQARNATDSYYEMAVARLTPDGILDAAFSGNGRTTAMVTTDGANGCGLAIDASDRIVVVGQADWAFALARFTDTGVLDPTFAGDGALTTDLTLSYDQANRVAVQPDGKIVVAGEAGSDWGPYSGDFGLVRLLADGSRDSTFGDNGQVLTNFTGFDVVTGLALDADDRIVAVGGSNLYNQPGTPPSYALARYLPDGALDPSFGTDGKIGTLIGSFSAYARGGVVVQPDGRLVVGGTAATTTTSSDFAVARYGFLADLDPLAHAGGPYILDEGGDVMLDGSGSTHPEAPDLTIVNYEWDLDYDGATFDTNVYGVRPIVQFLDDFASRTIAIRVTDSEGVQKIATTTLEVDNVAPTLTLSGPESVDVGSPYLLELAASDPGTDTISNWTVNWGDGDVETIPGSPPWATHIFDSGGQVYTISATATDEDGTFTAANTVDVEVLETGARLDGQTLLVTGTAGNDSADLKMRKTRDGRTWLDVNGTFIVGGVATFELNHVAFIQIALGEGDDRARIASQITLPARILAGGGNDLITVGGGATEVHAGPGDDQVMGGAAADRLFGDDGQDAISGGKGHDALDGGTGSDKLSGGDGNDTVSGGEDADTIYGDAGDDAMDGDGGSDVLDGGPGNDVLVGDAGDDRLLGGSGNDAYVFDADLLLGYDTVADRSGTDTLDFSSTTAVGVIVDLAQTGLQTVIPGNLDVTLSQGTTVENVIGGAADDFLFGNAQANRLDGGLGSDVLTGRAGNDTLLGGSDNDTYYFDAAQKLGTDTVLEVPGGGTDTLDFSTTAFVGVTVNLATTGTQTVVSKKLTLSLSAGNVIENVIGGRGADVLIGNALDNVLHGESGNDILVGGAGDDVLLGGPASDDGRDVLFGGSGYDTLRGGGFDDLLFGGNSTYHNETQGTADRAALNAILAEWTSTHGYSDRLRYVFAGGGLNKTFKLDGKLLSDSAADTLFGNDEQDWLLVHDEDLTPDLDPLLETKTALL